MTAALNGAPVAAAASERPRLTELDELFERDPNGLPRVVGPAAAAALLRRLVHLLAAGHAVTVEPLERELTTQQAAEILNVSRPYLVRLLDRGDIPWMRTGTHRRVRLENLLVYKRKRDADRRAALRELTQLSERLGLYGRPAEPAADR